MAKTPTSDTTSADGEKAGPAAKRRKFTAAYDILQGGRTVSAGKPVSLTEEEHGEALAVGAVTDPWSKAEAAD